MSASKSFQPHDSDIYTYLKPQGTTPNMRDFSGSIVLPHNETEFYKRLKNLDPSSFNKVGKDSNFVMIALYASNFFNVLYLVIARNEYIRLRLQSSKHRLSCTANMGGGR